MDATTGDDSRDSSAARLSPPVKTSPRSPAAATDAPGPGARVAPHETVASATGTSRTDETAMSTATATTTPALPGQQQVAASHALGVPQMMHGAASDSTAATSAAPPTVNAAAASAGSMTSSAMTPTTANYGMNASLAKSTGTLTPMGEDKINSTGPNGTQKAKQTRKKAPPADGETAKKPSPRVRAKADPNKAEKRKGSPARNNKNDTSSIVPPSDAATSAPMATVMPTAPTGATPSGGPSQGYPLMGEHTPASQQHELLPSQDTELRKQFLQRIYRQLQMTHRNQDDTMVRRLATNIEIDICRRASTRTDYVSLMNQHIHSLMQAELTNGTVGLQSSLYVPGVGMPAASNAMNAPVSSSNSMVQPGLQQTSAALYKQSSTPVPSMADMAQRASTPTQGSFMSLLSGQGSMQSYEASRAPTQYGAQSLPTQVRQPQYGAGNGSTGYSVPGQSPQQGANMKADPQSDPASQQAYGGQRMPSQPNPTSAPPEFVAQFQRLDRNGLVDLLWTQHRTVIQYQRRLAQLEVQLNGRQGAGGVVPTNNTVPTSAGIPSGYYNASPRQPAVGSVPASVTAEAEEQRARDRAQSRAAHQANQYGQPQYPPPQPPTTPQGGVNPQLYWEKVRFLSEAYLRPLYVAHQALSQHSAPVNSAQGAKAENVKHNIALACSILSEAPTTVQPRPLEVLDSIERFIQSTVVPIVRKVSPQHLAQQTSGPTQHMRPQQTPDDVNDASRNGMGTPAVSQPMPTPTSSMGMGYSSGPQPPATVEAAPPSAAAKGSAKAGTKAGAKAGAKAGGKKSPSNGTKKAPTPKAAGPKATTKAAAKKSPGKASGAKQTAAAKSAIQSHDGSQPVSAQAAPVMENVPKDRSETPMKTSTMADDDLNDFSDFADLDFDDDLQDPLVKVSSNKENATGVNARKRSIEDV